MKVRWWVTSILIISGCGNATPQIDSLSKGSNSWSQATLTPFGNIVSGGAQNSAVVVSGYKIRGHIAFTPSSTTAPVSNLRVRARE